MLKYNKMRFHCESLRLEAAAAAAAAEAATVATKSLVSQQAAEFRAWRVNLVLPDGSDGASTRKQTPPPTLQVPPVTSSSLTLSLPSELMHPNM